MTNNPSHVQTTAYSVSLTVTITDTTSVNSGGTANNNFTKSNISIPIFITDPCSTTTLQNVRVTNGSNAVVLNFMTLGNL